MKKVGLEFLRAGLIITGALVIIYLIQKNEKPEALHIYTNTRLVLPVYVSPMLNTNVPCIGMDAFGLQDLMYAYPENRHNLHSHTHTTGFSSFLKNRSPLPLSSTHSQLHSNNGIPLKKNEKKITLKIPLTH